MALTRSFEDHAYWPEYGLFVLRDTDRPPARHPVGPALAERDAPAFGSVALAGDGWIRAVATDEHHRVTLELHDTPPEPDPPEWTDVVESPFASGGAVGLALLTGGDPRDSFRLDGVGLYRMRFARRPDGPAFHYRVRFWRVDIPADPPCWLRRSAPLPATTDTLHPHAAGDLAMTLRWAREAGRETPTDWLAERLATTSQVVEETLRHASPEDLLPVGGPAEPRYSSIRDKIRAQAIRSGPPQRTPPVRHPGQGLTPMTDGPPPRAGIVTRQGSVVVWRDGRPTVLATVRPDPVRAVDTPHGIVVLAAGEATLVRPDGSLLLLASNVGPTAGFTADGRVALAEGGTDAGRGSRLLLLDPGSGERAVHPCDETLVIVGAHGDTVYARGRRLLRWRAGTDPQHFPPAVHTVRRDGTLLAAAGDTTLMITPDGTERPVPVRAGARLTPGGDFFYWYGHQPATMFLVPVDRPDDEPVTRALPPASRLGPALRHGPVWEDESHLLVPVDGRPAAVRVDVRTGATESVALTPDANHAVTLVEPW